MNVGRNLRMIAYSAVQATVDNYATNTGGVAAAALTGDSLQMEQTEGPSKLVWWSQLNQTNGGVRLLHNSGHFGPRGLPITVAAGNMNNLLNRGLPMPLAAGETLRLTVYGTNVAADVESGIMLLERRIQGGAGSYITFDDLDERYDKPTAVKVSLVAGAAGYGTEEALNAETASLDTGALYALTGMSSSVNVAGLSIRGSFTGGQRIGCPGNAVDAWPPANDFFCEMSRVLRGPYIPVFRGGDASNIMVSHIADENAASQTIDATLHLIQLRGGR